MYDILICDYDERENRSFIKGGIYFKLAIIEFNKKIRDGKLKELNLKNQEKIFPKIKIRIIIRTKAIIKLRYQDL